MQILIYAQPTDSNKKFYDQSQHSINQYGAKDRLCIWGAGIKLLYVKCRILLWTDTSLGVNDVYDVWQWHNVVAAMRVFIA